MISGPISPDCTPSLLNLCEVAKGLDVKLETLVKMSARGEFPRVMRLTKRVWRVDRAEYLAWLDTAWITLDADVVVPPSPLRAWSGTRR